jgi:hypothetical protein
LLFPHPSIVFIDSRESVDDSDHASGGSRENIIIAPIRLESS